MTVGDTFLERRSVKKTGEFADLLGDLEPGLLQAEDGAAVQGGRDLQHGVVVVETAADVGHSHPLLDDQHSGDHVVAAQDLRGDEVADLVEQRETQQCQLFARDTEDTTFWSVAYVVEVLCRSHDVRRLLVLVVLHPALSKEFPA